MTEQHKRDVAILGAGCAGLSLARYLADDNLAPSTTVFGEISPAAKQSHIWGFWHTSWLNEPAMLSRKSWQKWQIITPQGRVLHQASQHLYHALESEVWLNYCRDNALSKIEQKDILPENNKAQYVFDSRTAELPEGCLLQHFIGLEIKVPSPIFDPDTVTLMDFRCDQSRGIHFIYLLPFSADSALVESTIFSSNTEDNDFYITAIQTYLSEHYKLEKFEILRQETGYIPMGFLKPRDPSLLAIGANGGCIRPSSGYGFAFIQKQAQQIAKQLAKGQKIDKTSPPHRWLDSWLDRIFLAVLKAHPDIAPSLFLRMGKALNGDELAKFMSGLADFSVYAKLIFAMPKKMFIGQIATAIRQYRQKG